jgi:hypothetical protein
MGAALKRRRPSLTVRRRASDALGIGDVDVVSGPVEVLGFAIDVEVFDLSVGVVDRGK